MEYKEKLLMYLSRKTCVTLEDLVRDLGLNKDTAMVYLSRFAREGIITRRWLKANGRKYRLYCVNTSLIKELHMG